LICLLYLLRLFCLFYLFHVFYDLFVCLSVFCCSCFQFVRVVLFRVFVDITFPKQCGTKLLSKDNCEIHIISIITYTHARKYTCTHARILYTHARILYTLNSVKYCKHTFDHTAHTNTTTHKFTHRDTDTGTPGTHIT